MYEFLQPSYESILTTGNPHHTFVKEQLDRCAPFAKLYSVSSTLGPARLDSASDVYIDITREAHVLADSYIRLDFNMPFFVETFRQGHQWLEQVTLEIDTAEFDIDYGEAMDLNYQCNLNEDEMTRLNQFVSGHLLNDDDGARVIIPLQFWWNKLNTCLPWDLVIGHRLRLRIRLNPKIFIDLQAPTTTSGTTTTNHTFDPQYFYTGVARTAIGVADGVKKLLQVPTASGEIRSYFIGIRDRRMTASTNESFTDIANGVQTVTVSNGLQLDVDIQGGNIVSVKSKATGETTWSCSKAAFDPITVIPVKQSGTSIGTFAEYDLVVQRTDFTLVNCDLLTTQYAISESENNYFRSTTQGHVTIQHRRSPMYAPGEFTTFDIDQYSLFRSIFILVKQPSLAPFSYFRDLVSTRDTITSTMIHYGAQKAPIVDGSFERFKTTLPFRGNKEQRSVFLPDDAPVSELKRPRPMGGFYTHTWALMPGDQPSGALNRVAFQLMSNYVKYINSVLTNTDNTYGVQFYYEVYNYITLKFNGNCGTISQIFAN
jgi:hypothetical protein